MNNVSLLSPDSHSLEIADNDYIIIGQVVHDHNILKSHNWGFSNMYICAWSISSIINHHEHQHCICNVKIIIISSWSSWSCLENAVNFFVAVNGAEQTFLWLFILLGNLLKLKWNGHNHFDHKHFFGFLNFFVSLFHHQLFIICLFLLMAVKPITITVFMISTTTITTL